jgi:hypothetical protein
MESKEKLRPDPGLRLMDQVRQVLRYHHYAYSTEQAYCEWILRFVKIHRSKIHPQFMGKTEIDGFLSYMGNLLAVGVVAWRDIKRSNHKI